MTLLWSSDSYQGYFCNYVAPCELVGAKRSKTSRYMACWRGQDIVKLTAHMKSQ
jgi:hypothetical protein